MLSNGQRQHAAVTAEGICSFGLCPRRKDDSKNDSAGCQVVAYALGKE